MKHFTLSFLVILSGVFCAIGQLCNAGAEMIEIGKESMWVIGSAQNGVDIEFTITDHEGRKIGYDPRTNKWFHEFPGAYEAPFIYDEKTGNNILIAEPSLEDNQVKDYQTKAELNVTNGDYIVEVIGKGLTEYDLTVILRREKEGSTYRQTKKHFAGVTDKDFTSKFKMTYCNDPAKDPGDGVRIAVIGSLKQDIALSRKIGWIDNDGIMNSLVKQADAVEASIGKGNMETAKNQMNALINEVNAQKGKHISDKAIKVLVEDIQYIMDGLAK